MSLTKYVLGFTEDPEEREDISLIQKDVTVRLAQRLRKLALSYRPQGDHKDNPEGSPSRWGNTYSPGWCPIPE